MNLKLTIDINTVFRVFDNEGKEIYLGVSCIDSDGIVQLSGRDEDGKLYIIEMLKCEKPPKEYVSEGYWTRIRKNSKLLPG